MIDLYIEYLYRLVREFLTVHPFFYPKYERILEKYDFIQDKGFIPNKEFERLMTKSILQAYDMLADNIIRDYNRKDELLIYICQIEGLHKQLEKRMKETIWYDPYPQYLYEDSRIVSLNIDTMNETYILRLSYVLDYSDDNIIASTIDMKFSNVVNVCIDGILQKDPELNVVISTKYENISNNLIRFSLLTMMGHFDKFILTIEFENIEITVI